MFLFFSLQPFCFAADSLIFVVVVCFSEPGEELRRRLDGHALALQLGRVVAGLPGEQGLLWNYVDVVKTFEDLMKNPWKEKV